MGPSETPGFPLPPIPDGWGLTHATFPPAPGFWGPEFPFLETSAPGPDSGNGVTKQVSVPSHVLPYPPLESGPLFYGVYFVGTSLLPGMHHPAVRVLGLRGGWGDWGASFGVLGRWWWGFLCGVLEGGENSHVGLEGNLEWEGFLGVVVSGLPLGVGGCAFGFPPSGFLFSLSEAHRKSPETGSQKGESLKITQTTFFKFSSV